MQDMASAKAHIDWQKQEAPQACDIRIGLAERLLLTSIDGRQTVFAEKSQQVFEPNDASCAVLAMLETPQLPNVLFDRLTPAFAGDRDAIASMLVEWSQAGLLETFPAEDCNRVTPRATARMPALDTGIDLQFHGDDIGWFDCYRHLPPATGSGPCIQAWQAGELGIIKVTGEQGRIVPRHLLAAGFRFALVEAILRQTKCIVLHCASLIRGDRAILLLGEPGAGKSTLGMFASQHGFALGGDDIALFDPKTGDIAPLPLPLTLKQGSWAMLPRSDWRGEKQERVLRADNVEVVYLPLSQSTLPPPLTARALVLLDRRAEGAPARSDWLKIDCLRHLCHESKSRSGRASVEDMQALLAMVTSAETSSLRYADAAEAGKMLGCYFGD